MSMSTLFVQLNCMRRSQHTGVYYDQDIRVRADKPIDASWCLRTYGLSATT
jgi:hypothetical protein